MAIDLSTQGLAKVSSNRPWVTIGMWVVALVVAILLTFNFLGDGLTTEANFTNNPESRRGFDLLEERLRGPQRANEIVIVRSLTTSTVQDPAFKEFVEGIFIQITELGRVEGLFIQIIVTDLGRGVVAGGTHYYQELDDSLVSADRRTTILLFSMAGELEDAEDNVHLLQKIVDEADEDSTFRVLLTGSASVNKDFQEVSEEDLLVGETFGIPAALVILVLVFGTLAAAIIPVILAIFAIAVALGVSALIGQVFQLNFFVVNMIVMIGLAVGIDYSLFVVSRYREERARGLSKLEAISTSGATASRTVFFSGLTIVLALLGMLIVPATIFKSLALGAILVVIFSVLASLTLLPAVLSLMGDKVNSLRVPFIQRAQSRYDEGRRGGFWDWVARGVMRRPVISLVVTAGVLVAVSVFSLQLNTGFAGISTMPDDLESKQGFDILEEEFSFGLVTPAEIVIDGEIASEQVQAGVAHLISALESDTAFGEPRPLEVNPEGDLALLSVPVAGDPNNDEAIQAITSLREQYVPEAFSGVPAEVLVTGETAFSIDFFQMAADYTPIVFTFVLGLSFVLLTIVFRSLVVPLKAIFMNLLSVGAAYGLIVLVFQKGIGNGLLGFQQVDIVEAWIPLFLFTVLFGLSMDYHVFLLSRIRERYDQIGDNTEAVAFGIRSTGRLITGAALIMVAVFAGFASGSLVGLQQVGFGLAVAVLLDATIVRSVLVPASMKLLGRTNWYLPSILQWLPRATVEAREPAPAIKG